MRHQGIKGKSLKPALSFIFVTLLLDVMGFGLIIPVGPRLVQHLSGATEEQASRTVGFLFATYAAMQFLFAPVLGALSDRFGRRPVILFSLLGSGLDYLAQSLVQTVPWLFVTRVLNGVTGANITAASAYVADVTPPEKRAAGFGMIGAAFGLGFILGPLTGGWLGAIDIRLPFVAAGVLTLINWLYGLLVLPESLPPERRRPFSWKRANPVGALHGLGRYPLVAGLAAAMFLVNLAQFGLHATWVLYVTYRYGWDTFHVGMSLAVVGIGAAVVQGGLARTLIPALGERRSLVLGLGLAVCTFAGYGLAPQGWMIYVIILIGSLAGISQPAAQALITKAVRADEQGAVQGTLTSLQSLAGIGGPIIGGLVFAFAISGSRELPGAPFFVGSALIAAGLGVTTWALGRPARGDGPVSPP